MYDWLGEVGADAGEVGGHVGGVAVGDNAAQLGEPGFDRGELRWGVGVEQDFGEEIVVFRHQPACNRQMALECCPGGILMAHDTGEDQCRGERN